jgi:hypothetical protein
MNLWRGNGQGIPSRGVPRQDGKEGHPGVDVCLTSCSGGMDMSLPFVERKGVFICFIFATIRDLSN